MKCNKEQDIINVSHTLVWGTHSLLTTVRVFPQLLI